MVKVSSVEVEVACVDSRETRATLETEKDVAKVDWRRRGKGRRV